MRILRVALVLLVLSAFIASAAGVSAAAPTVKPTAKPTVMPAAKPTAKPTATATPVKKPGMMIDLSQMKSNLNNIYKNLVTGKRTSSSSANSPAAAVQSKANSIMNGVGSQLVQGVGKQSLGTGISGIPIPQSISQLGGLPKISNTKAKIGQAPGANLKIALAQGL